MLQKAVIKYLLLYFRIGTLIVGAAHEKSFVKFVVMKVLLQPILGEASVAVRSAGNKDDVIAFFIVSKKHIQYFYTECIFHHMLEESFPVLLIALNEVFSM